MTCELLNLFSSLSVDWCLLRARLCEIASVLLGSWLARRLAVTFRGTKFPSAFRWPLGAYQARW